MRCFEEQGRTSGIRRRGRSLRGPRAVADLSVLDRLCLKSLFESRYLQRMAERHALRRLER